MKENTPSPRYAKIFPEIYNSGVFTAMSPHQFKVLGFMLRNHPNIYASEATIVKGCKLNKATVGNILRGFVLTGLFSKTRRSKGAGLQSSNRYDLNDLTEHRLAEHIVASFSHIEFKATMKALYRGGKDAAAVDQELVEQFRWSPTTQQSSEVPQVAAKPKLSTAVAVEPDKLEVLNEAVSVSVEQTSSSVTNNDGQEILDWFKQISIRGTIADGLLAKVQNQGLPKSDLVRAYGELQADKSAKNPTALLIYRINEGLIVPSSDYDDDYAEGTYELQQEIDNLLLGPSCNMDDTVKTRLSKIIYQAMCKLRVWEATDESKDARTICRYLDKDGKIERAMLDPWDLQHRLNLCVSMDFSICHFDLEAEEIARRVMSKLPNMVPTIDQLKAEYPKQITAVLPAVKAEFGMTWPADEPMPEDAAEQLAEYKVAKADAA